LIENIYKLCLNNFINNKSYFSWGLDQSPLDFVMTK